MGEESATGIRYFLEASQTLAMTLKVNLSSCVPATDLETSGARLEAADLLPLRAHPAALGLAVAADAPTRLRDVLGWSALACYAAFVVALLLWMGIFAIYWARRRPRP